MSFICIITAKFATINPEGLPTVLIQFNVANFRSFKEKQTLSMVASANKELLDSNTFDVPLGDKSSIKLLRSAAIYGPNAAGKTNLLESLEVMKKIVLTSASEKHRGDSLPVTSFRLHPESRDAPSEFEVIFIIGKTRYQYGFSATKERIMEEWLFAYPGSRPQRWFTRSWKGTEYQWRLGARLTGEKTLWRKATRDNALFLSTAIQLNSLQLQEVYDWFNNNLRLADVTGWSPTFSASLCENEHPDNEYKKSILAFIKEADLGIDDIHAKKQSIEQEDKGFYKVSVVRQDVNGKPIAFDMDDESDGTQKMFSLAAPWIHSLKRGYVICLDELHDNLHPVLVKFLVRLFNSSDTNPNYAQLIFTTHETYILDQGILRRDQIWFCEKDEEQATQVFPLTDFSPRKGRENLESAYLSGRYGAVPYIKENRARIY